MRLPEKTGYIHAVPGNGAHDDSGHGGSKGREATKKPSIDTPRHSLLREPRCGGVFFRCTVPRLQQQESGVRDRSPNPMDALQRALFFVAKYVLAVALLVLAVNEFVTGDPGRQAADEPASLRSYEPTR